MKGDKAVELAEEGADFLLFTYLWNRNSHILELAMRKNFLPCSFRCHCQLLTDAVIQTPK